MSSSQTGRPGEVHDPRPKFIEACYWRVTAGTDDNSSPAQKNTHSLLSYTGRFHSGQGRVRERRVCDYPRSPPAVDRL